MVGLFFLIPVPSTRRVRRRSASFQLWRRRRVAACERRFRRAFLTKLRLERMDRPARRLRERGARLRGSPPRPRRSANRIPAVLPHSAAEIARQSLPTKFRFPDHEMERPLVGGTDASPAPFAFRRVAITPPDGFANSRRARADLVALRKSVTLQRAARGNALVCGRLQRGSFAPRTGLGDFRSGARSRSRLPLRPGRRRFCDGVFGDRALAARRGRSRARACRRRGHENREIGTPRHLDMRVDAQCYVRDNRPEY